MSDVPQDVRNRIVRMLPSLVIYLLVTGALIMIVFILYAIGRYIARNVFLLQVYWDRGIYSTFEALIVIGIYLASPVLAIPITRWIVRGLHRFRNGGET